MRIIITGATGLIGSALVESLIADGHQVTRLVRQGKTQIQASPIPQLTEVLWNPQRMVLDPRDVEGHDVVVNLAGESIADGRWSEEKKRRIYDSRIDSSKLLVKVITELTRPPKVAVSASAIGYYGSHHKREVLTEQSQPGSDFLAQVCVAWEYAFKPLATKSIRTVFMRFGIVLASQGGALSQMLTPFKLGIGGKLGSGDQYMSWVTLIDAIRVIRYIIDNSTLKGPVNVVAPTPITNSEFTAQLGKALSRPTLLTVPAFALRFMFGEMADAGLLASSRVLPEKLISAGYEFRFPELDGALNMILS